MKPRDVCSCGALRSADDPKLVPKSMGMGFFSVPAEQHDVRQFGHCLQACRVCAVVYFPGPVVV